MTRTGTDSLREQRVLDMVPGLCNNPLSQTVRRESDTALDKGPRNWYSQ